MNRKIFEIANDIQKEWKKVNYAAKPYLDAMLCLENITDNYGFDTGKSVVLYFLANANSFRGEKARELKKELRQICGIK